jgi:hypothetical protein
MGVLFVCRCFCCSLIIWLVWRLVLVNDIAKAYKELSIFTGVKILMLF